MIPVPLLMQWSGAGLLVAMATLALREVRSQELVSKALLLWPLVGLLYGILALAAPLAGLTHGPVNNTLFVMGAVFIVCSLQALLANIGRLPRWPSGAVWLAFLLIALVNLWPYRSGAEPHFHTFYRRLTGFVWAALGIAKVAAQRGVAHDGAIPVWIRLLYVQAVLMASAVW